MCPLYCSLVLADISEKGLAATQEECNAYIQASRQARKSSDTSNLVFTQPCDGM